MTACTASQNQLGMNISDLQTVLYGDNWCSFEFFGDRISASKFALVTTAQLCFKLTEK